MLLPLILPSLGRNQKVGILTADGPKLKVAPALKNCGVSEADMSRIEIYGAENCPQMKNVVGEVGIWDLTEFEGQLLGVAKEMLADHPDIASIVLECTEFPAGCARNAGRTSIADLGLPGPGQLDPGRCDAPTLQRLDLACSVV